VRVIAATKRDLKEEVRRGKFREDLYYRLSVVPITVPPLRGRREDIPTLVEHFLELARLRDPKQNRAQLSKNSQSALAAHDWPGNVRELRNVLDRAVYLASGAGDQELRLVDLPIAAKVDAHAGDGFPEFNQNKSYRETREHFEVAFEKRYVDWLLDRHRGNISAAAREARMDRKHLYDLARKHGLRPRRSRTDE
jgi:DNA-binding NtrC family response regulator